MWYCATVWRPEKAGVVRMWPWFGLVLAWLTTSCLDNSCTQIAEDPVVYTDGKTNSARTFYQSSTPKEPFLRFPAGRVLRMEHRLGQKPSIYEVFVSFVADGTDHASASGNLALLNVDERYVQVENNTCTDLFVRVTAALEPAESPSPDAAAPIDPTSARDAGETDAPLSTGDAN